MYFHAAAVRQYDPIFKIKLKWGADMRQKNVDRRDPSDIQNRFTAYLLTAVQRRKFSYMQRQWLMEENEIPIDFREGFALKSVMPDMMENLPLQMQMEDSELLHALEQLSERDRYILLTKILDGRSLAELAVELQMKYSSIASAYERAIRKIRKRIGSIR